jgi:hypothetical protein
MPVSRLLLVLLCLTVSGCFTVSPVLVEPSRPSYDQNEATSGIISDSPSGFIVTPHFVERYNGLVDLWGSRFVPALKRNEGISIVSGQYVIDRERMAKFVQMNLWRKSGRIP